MSDRVICYFDRITVGDICTLFGGNTDAYEYRIEVSDDGALVLMEPK